MVGRIGGRGAVVAALVALVAADSLGTAGCGGGDSAADPGATGVDPSHGTPGGDAPGADPAAADALRERPWEVLSSEGETYLEDVFYADPIENEQVMPYAVDGRALIDRMVYPTIGNPNLYVKDDAKDELVIVLRVEPDAYAHLSPKVAPANGDRPVEVRLPSGDEDAFAFFLTDRGARSVAEGGEPARDGGGAHRIVPSKVLMNAEPDDMPASLKKRHTLRFVFDQAAMAGVPAGLYDARFEVRKGGQVYANVYEWQYNAVRVFDHESEEYTALNVTDTQVSTNSIYGTLTADKLDDFVDAVNGSADPMVRSAGFITFNGDLHNGGSPGTLGQRSVATTYASEAKRVIGALKRLNLPIFLTPGNHDGYSSTGVVPGPVKTIDNALGTNLEKVVGEQNNVAWPDFSWDAYAAYLASLAGTPEGRHVDLVTGAFTRSPGDTFAEAWKEIPRSERNEMLYDGFHQWQKSYGPLYESWKFGKNRYVSLNTFELRQHRRSGWGMYTVNYGGAMSKTQLAWLDREIGRARAASQDIVLLMHHDPRGGHKGQDFGYYFPIIDYKGFEQSAINYLVSDKFAPLACKLDDAQLTIDEQDGCLHDGLQEWMAPDPDFDKDGAGYFMSGVALLQKIVQAPEIRTLLIGHAHLNSMEVLQAGDTLVPGRVSLDGPSKSGASWGQRLAWLEGANPVRNHALGDEDETALRARVGAWTKTLDAMLGQATPAPMRTLSGDVAGGPRELAVIRLTSNADLASDKYQNKSAYGWSILHVTSQATGAPRINRVSFFVHVDGDAFDEVETVDVDRTKSMRAKDPNNPVAQLFTW